MRQRANHQKFEQLANSSVAEQGRKGCFVRDIPSERGPEYDAQGNPIPAQTNQTPLPWEKYANHKGNPWDRPPAPTKQTPCFVPDDDPNAFYYTPSKLNSGEIKTLHFDENHEISTIETQNGQTLYPTPAPSAWLYLLIALFPLLGFFIPWGIIRAIGWVGAGFVASSK